MSRMSNISERYYIVRDKNTGLYFRGKGVNKWGKYYNQASIYRVRKMAENAVTEENRRGANAEVIEIKITEVSESATIATTDTKTGHWVPNDYFKGHYHCSECKKHIEDRSGNPAQNYPYCHCGAKILNDSKGE